VLQTRPATQIFQTLYTNYELGQAQVANNDISEAMSIFQEALALERDFFLDGCHQRFAITNIFTHIGALYIYQSDVMLSIVFGAFLAYFAAEG